MFFTVTFVCFTVPFLIEIILNVCAFPNEASEEMRSVYQAYDKRNNVDGTGGTFWMCGIYYLYPGLYAVFIFGSQIFDYLRWFHWQSHVFTVSIRHICFYLYILCLFFGIIQLLRCLDIK